MAGKLRAGLSLPSRRRERSSTAGARAINEIAGLQVVSDAVIYQHVFDNADREVGGVLVGRTAADGGLPLITGAIPAISADEQRATLTFTQEAWAHVHRVLEREFPPDEQIVGWYHSHPGFGIFLSGHDLFIHENFFNAPSQIAVVVDPHARMEGVFAWRDGELAALFEHPTPGGWIAACPVRQLASDVQAGTDNGSSPRVVTAVPHDRHPLLALVIAGIVGVVIGFAIWSLAEGQTSTSAPPAAKTAPANVRTAKPATTPNSHIQVYGQE
jgi:proteasome lid subunit RPN8/RPN11